MRNPDELEKVVCPESKNGKTYAPEKVFDRPSTDGKLRGTLAKHSHSPRWFTNREECPWSGHPVEVLRDIKKD